MRLTNHLLSNVHSYHSEGEREEKSGQDVIVTLQNLGQPPHSVLLHVTHWRGRTAATRNWHGDHVHCYSTRTENDASLPKTQWVWRSRQPRPPICVATPLILTQQEGVAITQTRRRCGYSETRNASRAIVSEADLC